MVKAQKIATLIFLCFLLLASAVYAVYYVWTKTTTIIVTEPFSISSTLPETASLVPGTYNYWINVTNNGGIGYNATLYYWIQTQNANCTITPKNETSYKVSAHTTTPIPVNVTVILAPNCESGNVTITWAISRTAVVP